MRLRLESLENRRMLSVDLAVAFHNVPAEALPGDHIIYEVVVSNNGDERADCATIEHTPTGLAGARWDRIGHFPTTVDLDALHGVDGFTLGRRDGIYSQPIGDVNGDGFDDLLVNRFGSAQDEVAIFFGHAEIGSEGFLLDPTEALNGAEGFIIQGALGQSQARVGDLNGDGYSDFLLTTTDATTQHHVVFGRSNWGGQPLVQLKSLTGISTLISTTLHSATAAGDINGDGLDDLLLQHADRTIDKFQLLLGQTSFPERVDVKRSEAVVAFDSRVRTIARVGDYNGDGYDDFIGGVQGQQDLFIAGRDLDARDRIFSGEPLGGDIGARVTWIGDINGDGYADLATNAVGDQHSSTHIVYGNASGTLNQTSRVSVGKFSVGVIATAGDVNHDGIDDLLIGDLGIAYAIAGSSDLASQTDVSADEMGIALFQTRRSGHADFFRFNGGVSFVASGFGNSDLNGDGVSDVILGGVNHQSGEKESHVIFGQAGGSGSGPIRNTLSVEPGGVVRYRIEGTFSANRALIELEASANLCSLHAESPSADLEINMVRPDDSIAGESVNFELHVKNIDETRSATARLQYELSEWLIDPLWTLETGYAPKVNLTAAVPYQTNFVYYFNDYANAGDFNGDGQDDVAMSALSRDASIWYNAVKVSRHSVTSISSAGYVTVPLTGVGDVNGDGFDDVAFGHPVDESLNQFRVLFGGSVYDPAQDVVVTIDQGTPSNPRVESIKGKGDFNGDGFDDIVVTSTSSHDGFPRRTLHVVFGGARRGSLRAIDLDKSNASSVGWKTQLAGDLNGDGFDDIVGTIGDQATVYWGDRLAGQETTKKTVMDGVRSASVVGDVNGDGKLDLLVSALESKPLGVLGDFLVLDTARLSEHAAVEFSDLAPRYGVPLRLDWETRKHAAIGDINGDGLDEFLLVPESGSPAHSAFVVMGTPNLEFDVEPFDLREFDGLNGFEIYKPDSEIFSNVFSRSDINGDGLDDIAFETFHVRRWSELVVLPGAKNFHTGTGDVLNQMFVLGPGATARMSVQGTLREDALLWERPSVASCQCLEQSDANTTDNLAKTEVSTMVQGDLDQDGEVAFSDFLILSANYGSQDASSKRGDINRDGEISFADFVILAANFGKQG